MRSHRQLVRLTANPRTLTLLLAATVTVAACGGDDGRATPSTLTPTTDDGRATLSSRASTTSTTELPPLPDGCDQAPPPTWEEFGTVHTEEAINPPVAITIEAEPDTVCPGGATWLRVTFRNDSSEPIIVPSPEVVLRQGERWRIASLDEVRLDPGESVTMTTKASIPLVEPGNANVYIRGAGAGGRLTIKAPTPTGPTPTEPTSTSAAVPEVVCEENCNGFTLDDVTYGLSSDGPRSPSLGAQVATLPGSNFLPAGTKVYEIQGEQPWFRLAAGGFIYQAIDRAGASTGGDMVDLGGVDTIVAHKTTFTPEGGPRLAPVSTISDPAAVAALVATITSAPVVRDWLSGPVLPGQCLFEFSAPGREPMWFVTYALVFDGTNFLIPARVPPERTVGLQVGSAFDGLCPPDNSSG